ncbi:MAG TPA: ABC transporter permease [Devosiaceae bacterium]|nr:ABC transporter permease [Devosiaceae bacterium]
MFETVLGTRDPGFQIVPEKSVAGRTLMLLVAIMTFLSCVTFGGVVLVQQSALAWSADVGREVTIQIRPIEGAVMESNLRIAVEIAESNAGVARVQALSETEGEALLRPWLGDIDIAELSVPRLIVVQLSNPSPADLAALASHLADAVPGASLDTHTLWRQQINAMAGTVVVSGLLILALILVATMLAIVFATRGTMASNRDIVDVLHFIGASNRFVAGEFQSRFLSIGLKGGAAGGAGAVVFFLAAGFVTGVLLPDPSATQLTILFDRFLPGLTGFFGLVGVVILIAVITAVTSRLTVHRFLAQIAP